MADQPNIEPSLHPLPSTLPYTDGQALAPQACHSCKRQKRKCDKALPSCSLCVRIGRACEYGEESRVSSNPTPEEFQVLRQEVAELKELLTRSSSAGASNDTRHSFGGAASNGSSAYFSNSPSILAASDIQENYTTPAWPPPSSFPTLYFLDSDAYEYDHRQIHAPHIRVPPSALSCLEGSMQLRQMTEHYFLSVHTYFPIVCKIRLYQHLSNALHEPGADIALLFMAMRLVCSEVRKDVLPQTQLYNDVKNFYHYVESQNGFSIQLIQALLLVSLYEVGHAIYPAAYLTIGHAARLGIAMGIHDRGAPQMLTKPTTWTEQEERRRVWWGVVVLDRFVNTGNRGKPFATPEPSLDAHLPTDDDAWDRGTMLVAAPLALSASPSAQASPFARTCQASHLLGKVINHNNDLSLPLGYRFDEALQLHRTTKALAAVLQEGEDASAPFEKLCTSRAICYSALLSLYEKYSCTERAIPGAPETQLVMQRQSIEGFAEGSAAVLQLARNVKAYAEHFSVALLSPFVIDAFYQAAAYYAWFLRESSDPISGQKVAELKEVLSLCDQRWRVAGEYMRIVDAMEYAQASAIS